nr:ESX-1 secretion-associated protein EspI-like [Aegilops tauschii subsp. strangulata]
MFPTPLLSSLLDLDREEADPLAPPPPTPPGPRPIPCRAGAPPRPRDRARGTVACRRPPAPEDDPAVASRRHPELLRLDSVDARVPVLLPDGLPRASSPPGLYLTVRTPTPLFSPLLPTPLSTALPTPAAAVRLPRPRSP